VDFHPLKSIVLSSPSRPSKPLFSIIGERETQTTLDDIRDAMFLRFFTEFILSRGQRFFTSFRMTGEGLRMTKRTPLNVILKEAKRLKNLVFFSPEFL
jgi:hypothetical protein